MHITNVFTATARHSLRAVTVGGAIALASLGLAGHADARDSTETPSQHAATCAALEKQWADLADRWENAPTPEEKQELTQETDQLAIRWGVEGCEGNAASIKTRATAGATRVVKGSRLAAGPTSTR